jgi:hypothetical protein
MKHQNLLFLFGFLAIALLNTRCDGTKPDDMNPNSSKCDTCKTLASCSRFTCTSRPMCTNCNVVAQCAGTPAFAGKKGGVAFSAPVVKAYLYDVGTGTSAVKHLVLTAQTKNTAGIDETFNLHLIPAAGIVGSYSFMGQNSFAYLPATGQTYNQSASGTVIIGAIGADSTISGEITNVSSKRVLNNTPASFTNIVFSNVCLKGNTYIPTKSATATTYFEMPQVAVPSTPSAAAFVATKIKTYIGEGIDIGLIVVEAEDASGRKFTIKVPMNTPTNSSPTALNFPRNGSSAADLDVIEVYAKYKGSPTLTSFYDSSYNGGAGVPLLSCAFGLIEHNKLTRTLKIDRIVLKLVSNGTIKDFAGGKLSVTY